MRMRKILNIFIYFNVNLIFIPLFCTIKNHILQFNTNICESHETFPRVDCTIYSRILMSKKPGLISSGQVSSVMSRI